MFVTELDTFVLKFHQLWKAGHTAHLDLDTCAGKAWVGLRVQLGEVPGPPHHQHRPSTSLIKKKDSPSRQRRRARRAAARQVNVAEEASNEETVEETVNTDPAKKPVEQSENKKTTEEEVNENSTELEAEQAENPKNESENLILNDEFCSDNDFMKNATNINTLVDELLVKPGDNEKDEEDIMNLIDYNLKIVGIDVIKIEKEMIQSNQVFKVKIQPSRLEVLKSESFPLRNWSWRPHR